MMLDQQIFKKPPCARCGKNEAFVYVANGFWCADCAVDFDKKRNKFLAEQQQKVLDEMMPSVH